MDDTMFSDDDTLLSCDMLSDLMTDMSIDQCQDMAIPEDVIRIDDSTEGSVLLGLSDAGELDVALEEAEYIEDDPVYDSEADSEDLKSDAVRGLEALSLRFLKQLSDALPPLQSYSEDQGSQQTSTGAHAGKDTKMGEIALQLADRRKEGRYGKMGTRTLRFPRRMKPPRSSTRSLATLFRVVDLSHAALLSHTTVTKRDIYYQDPSLFSSQATVDKLVDDIAATLELPRAALNIRASPKGLFASSALTIHLKSGDTVGGRDSKASLIPVSEDIERFEIAADLKWVLIVEKEAVFQSLCAMEFACHAALPGRGIIVTGKGYPDLATRHFVSSLCDSLPESIVILALMDADPYGIEILSTYMRSTEGMRDCDTSAAERIEWIGVWGTEWGTLGIDRAALLPLSNADQKKALSMLRGGEHSMPSRWKKELSHMLFSQRKAEIQILSTLDASASLSLLETVAPATHEQGKSDGALVRYLLAKILSRLRGVPETVEEDLNDEEDVGDFFVDSAFDVLDDGYDGGEDAEDGDFDDILDFDED